MDRNKIRIFLGFSEFHGSDFWRLSMSRNQSQRMALVTLADARLSNTIDRSGHESAQMDHNTCNNGVLIRITDIEFSVAISHYDVFS